MSKVDKAAALQKLKGKEEKLSDESVEAFLGQAKTSDQAKNALKPYGADKNVEALMQKKGITPELIHFSNTLKSVEIGSDQYKGIEKDINKELKKLFAIMTPKELAGAAAEGKWFTRKDDALASHRLVAVAEVNPSAVANSLAKAKGEDFDSLIEVIRKSKFVPDIITVKVDEKGIDILHPKDINKQQATLNQLRDYIDEEGQKNKKGFLAALSRGLNRRLMYSGEETTTGGGAPAEEGEEKKS